MEVYKGFSDIPDKVTNFTDNGKCIKCGECCGRLLPFSKSECKNIFKYIRKNKIQKGRRGLNNVKNAMLDMTCPFYDGIDKVCLIYEIRPKVCRLFKCDKPNEAEIAALQITHNLIDTTATFFGEKSVMDVLGGE